MSLFGGLSNTQQKTQKHPANISGNDLSTNQEGIVVPYLAGVGKLSLQWIAPVYNPKIVPVTTSGSKFSPSTTTGYKYFGDLLGLICLGPLDVIYAIIFDNNIVWPDVKNLKQGWATGGLFRVPGQDYVNISGRKWDQAWLFWGTETQQPSQNIILKPRGTPPSDPNFDPRDPSTWPNNPAQGGQQTFDSLAPGDATPKQGHYDQHPDYLGMALLLFKGCHFGEGRNASPSVSVIVGRSTSWFGGTNTVLDLAGVVPPGAIYEALTNGRYGAELIDADLDQTFFENLRVAMANFPLSPLITQKTRHKDFLNQFCQYYDGWVRRKGKIIQVGRFDHGNVGTNFPHIVDDDRTAEPELKANGWGGTYNLFSVIYNNRHRYFKSDVERYSDEANREAVGESRTQEFQGPWIVDPDIAQMFVRNAGHLAALQSVTGSDTIKRERIAALGLNVGDRYYLDSTSLALSFLVNIMEMEWPKSKDGSVKLTIEVEKGTYPKPYVPAGAAHDQDFNFGPEPIRQMKIVELPVGLRDDPSATELAILALRPNIQVTGFRVWASKDGAAYDEVTTENNFAAFGLLNTDYPDTTPNPDTGAGAQIYLYGVGLDNIVTSQTDSARDDGNLLLFLDGEIMSVGKVIAQGNGLYSIEVRRGMYKTPIQYHSAGSYAFFIRRSDIVVNKDVNFAPGLQFYLKLQTHTQTLDDDLSSIDPILYTFNTPATHPAPVVSPGTGSYSTTQNVALTIDVGLTARFTLDGTPVTAASAEWPKASGAYTTLAITASSTLRVKGFAADGSTTPETIAVYTFVASGAGTPTAAAPSFSFSGTQGQTAGQLTMRTPTPGSVIKYAKNGVSQPDYSAPITIALNDVIVAHTEASGYLDSPSSTFDNTYTGGGSQPPAQTADPIFLPAPGLFHKGGGSLQLFIGMACPTSDALERFTTDGSTPTQTSGIAIGQNAGISGGWGAAASPLTLKVIAFAPSQNNVNSNVISGLYTIDTDPDPLTQMPDPQLGPSGGTYILPAGDNNMSFILVTSVPGASLRYTLNGNTPSPNNGTLIAQNAGRIDLGLSFGLTEKTYTILAIAYGLGKTPSNVKSFTVTLKRRT